MNTDTRPHRKTIRLQGHPWLNEPAIILLGYVLLYLLVIWAEGSLMCIVFAAMLALFGSGLSLFAALFPQSNRFDVVEQLALSTALSMAVGGVGGFVLARSSWGLNVQSMLVFAGLFNLACFGVVVYRRRLDSIEGPVADWFAATIAWLGNQWESSRTTTVALLVLLISGGFAVYHFALTVNPEPAMVEFYLLNANGQAEDYPRRIEGDESLEVMYGIANGEKEAIRFRVAVSAEGRLLANSDEIWLAPGEKVEKGLLVSFPSTLRGQTKVDFELHRGTEILYLYRTLHLAVEITPRETASVR
jgi:uncharacterized membrane protein